MKGHETTLTRLIFLSKHTFKYISFPFPWYYTYFYSLGFMCSTAVFECSQQFFLWQCLTWLESEMDFSLNAVSDLNLKKHCQALAILHYNWESPSLLYSIWSPSKFDFWGEQSFSFITIIWTFLMFETKYSQKINWI